MLLAQAPFGCLNRPHPVFGGDHLARVGRLARTEVLSLDVWGEEYSKISRAVKYWQNHPMASCPFCDLPPARIVLRNEWAYTVRDAYPLAPGHTLVIPHRHVGSFFELEPHEQQAMLELASESRRSLDREFKPDGYNLGINDGAAAGQTVPHVHLHVIPRKNGDVEDPRGGIRWVLPEKARYWS